ncbi:LOW QUALITY PROTEIN: apolipophorins-like [Homalodisca vitripennis]|nr:LOW QUALITY PROTEIN: apolipophorins-like [Homalodisca vitripennis]
MEVPRGALCLLLLYCFYVSSFANPTCKRNCRGAGGPFLPGQVYKYHLKGSTVTQLPGSPDDVTSLGISATAEVFVESKCQHVLRLSDVEVKGPDGKQYNGLSADCAKPIRFSYSDGKLDELCGQADDEGVSLNIKRAVISLLSSVKNQDEDSGSASENDVFGICPTEFSISHEGSKVVIHKTKDLNRCALREDFNLPFSTTPYQAVQSSFGKFETSPLLGSQLKVLQEIENGVLQKAEGTEIYNYRPMMNPEAGATIKVLYTLTLESSGPGAIPANVNSPKKIFYEAAHDSDGIKNQGSIAAALQKAVAAIDPVATPEAAKEFANLVHVIEQGNKADILAAYSVAQGKTAKNIFLDGLLYAGSAESVEAAAELLSSKRIPEESALLWYLDLNFVKHVSRGSLTSLLPLLSGDKVPYQAYLGIGSVAGKFCVQHPQLCETSQEYNQLLARLAAPLAGGCKVDSHEKENNIIASLKGLRNTRHLTAEIAQQISQCAADRSARSRVRVAALEAFHADASKPVLIQTAITILHNVEEDSELRIQAYLALVANPTPKVADIVKELIDKEPVNQVGSFIVSHLRNIRASTNPEKQAAKAFLGNIISKKKFPFDQRKFSKNQELSYSLDALNVGAAGELNRIFSQKSFIYRSVSLNLTTQLFGHSVNLAEVGLRLENLEWYFEKYFGHRGILKSKGSELADEYADEAEKVVNKTLERNKRSINKQQTLAAIDKIHLGPDYEDRHTNIDLSLKLFGSDIAWMNYHHDKFDFEGMKKKLYGKKDEFMDNSKNMDIDYKKARTFLDAGLTYPTGLGLGLKIKVNGNYAVNLKFNGKADLNAIMNNPRNAHFAFQFVPSGSLELASTLAVDADVVESGVKVSANLHSSTGTDLTVKVLDGYGVDVKLGLPVKKQEILNFHSDVFSVIREKTGSEVETPVKFNVKREDHGGCFDQLNTLIGLTVCGEVSVPLEGFKVLSPAYGPSKASLRIEKEDESLTAYHFRAFYDNKQQDKVSLEVLLDTPNSKTDRKFLLSVKGSMKPQKQLLIALESPLTVPTTFEALVIDTELEQAISAKLTSDTAEHFFKIGAHISGDINRRKYEPILEYKFPETASKSSGWIGRKGVKGGRQQQQSALGISGAVYVEKHPGTPYRKYELESVTVTTPSKKLTLDGTITIDANLVETDLKASYENNTFTLKSKVQKLGERKYTAEVEVLPSQYPDLAGNLKWQYERTPHKIEHNLVIVHGPDLTSEMSRLSIAQLFTYKHESAKDFDFHTVNTVSYPLLAFTGSLKGGVAPKSVMYDVDVTYEKHQIKSKLDAKRGMKEPSDYSIEFEAKALENSVDLTLKHERVSATKSKFTNSLQMKPGGKYQLNALVENNVKTGDVHQSLEAELKMPQEPKSVKVKAEHTHNSKEFDVEFELIAGNKHVVDFEVECNKAADPSGKFKLSLPRYIDSHGVYDTKAGKGTGSFYINVLKTGRKIEGKGELTHTSSHIVGFGELLWDANKDPSKKVYVKTDTSCSGKSIDTKNILQVFEHKTEINLKGTMDGPLLDGSLEGEAEVVLPSGRIVTAKVDRVFHLVSEDNKIEGTWELADYASRGAQPRKLTLKLAGKNINPRKVQFDGQVDLTYMTPNKEDLILHFVGKKVPQGEKWTIAGQGSVTGSMVKHPIHSKLNAEVTEQLLKGRMTDDGKFPSAHYDFELKAGDEIEVASNGKINQDQLNNDIEIKLPSDLAIKSVKWNMLHVSAQESTGKKIVNSNAIQWNGDKFVKYNAESYEKSGTLHGKITWETHEQSPRTVTYKVDDSEDKVDLDLALEWEGKKADFSLKADVTSEPVYLKISSNVPDHGNFEIDISAKDNMESTETLITVVGNGKKMAFHARHSKSKTSPSLDIGLELPQGKSRFYGKLETKGEAHYLVESKIEWLTNGGGTFEANGEVNVKSFDDLFIKLFIDSPALNMNKVEFEAGRQLTKSSAKTLYFRGKANEKQLSGSFTLVPKEDNLYEGNGVLNIGDGSYPLKFKLKFDVQRKDQKEMLLDMEAGKYSYYAHIMGLTDEASGLYKVETVTKYCKNDKCHNEELKLSKHKTGPMEYEITFGLQLSMSLFFMLDHPLILKGHSKRQGLEIDRILEVEYGPEKLQYHEYVQKDRAGAELTLPKRTIAVEAIFYLQDSKDNPSFKIEGNFWMDKKNAAADKTSVVLASDTTKRADAVVLSHEAHFSTPGMKELSLKNDLTVNVKDHTIHAKFEADVFSKKNQKFVIEYKLASNKNEGTYSGNDHLHIYSKGLNIDTQLQRKASISKNGVSYIITGSYIDSKQNKREGVAQFIFDPKHSEVVLKLPEGTLYAEESTLVGNPDSLNYHMQGETYMLGYKFEEELDVKKKGPHFKYILTIIQKAENNPQFTLDIGVDLDQLAEINLKYNKKLLLGLEVALDEAHYLKSKYQYNTDVAKDYLTQEKKKYSWNAKRGIKNCKEYWSQGGRRSD